MNKLESNISCPLCNRIMIDGPSVDKHHLIPKTFGGKEIISLHKICHRKIHSSFTERELYQYYNTIKRLHEHEEIKKFIKWIKNKDPEFYSGSKETNRRKGKKRR